MGLSTERKNGDGGPLFTLHHVSAIGVIRVRFQNRVLSRALSTRFLELRTNAIQVLRTYPNLDLSLTRQT